MSERSALAFTAGIGLAAAAGLAYLALAVVEQRRVLTDLAERQAADRAALAIEVDRLRDRLGDVRAEFARGSDDAKADRQRLGALLHDLEVRVEELRLRTEPMVADLPELPIGAQ